MDGMPDLKTETNRDRERDKKGGLLGWLSRLGGAGEAGLDPLAAGLGRAGMYGGLLATKAGLIGLILAGATIAGGVGVVGYKYFGPGSEPTGSNFSSLFAPKPKSAQGEQAGAGSPAGAGSTSLQYAAQANQNEGLADPDKQAKDAAEAAASANGASAGVGQAHDNNAAPGGAAAKNGLNTDRKFGALTKFGESGTVGSVTVPRGAAGSDAVVGAKAVKGSLSASGARAASSNLKGLGGMRRAAGAVGQAFGALRDNRSAGSSYSAGTTYDGSGASGFAGAPAGNPAGAGVGNGGQGATQGQPSQSFSSPNEFPTPSPSTATDATPWKQAISTATMLLAAAALIIMISRRFGTLGKPAQMALAGLAALIGMMVMAIGFQIAHGQYGQGLQGGMFIAAGGFIAAAAAASMMSIAPGISSSTAKMMNMIMVLSGAAALGTAAIGFLSKPKTYSPSTFPNGIPPDIHLMGFQAPTDGALDRFVA